MFLFKNCKESSKPQKNNVLMLYILYRPLVWWESFSLDVWQTMRCLVGVLSEILQGPLKNSLYRGRKFTSES